MSAEAGSEKFEPNSRALRLIELFYQSFWDLVEIRARLDRLIEADTTTRGDRRTARKLVYALDTILPTMRKQIKDKRREHSWDPGEGWTVETAVGELGAWTGRTETALLPLRETQHQKKSRPLGRALRDLRLAAGRTRLSEIFMVRYEAHCVTPVEGARSPRDARSSAPDRDGPSESETSSLYEEERVGERENERERVRAEGEHRASVPGDRASASVEQDPAESDEGWGSWDDWRVPGGDDAGGEVPRGRAMGGGT